MLIWGLGRGDYFVVFPPVAMVGFRGLRHWPWRAIALALQSQAIGTVSEPVEGSGAEQSVGEGVAPLREVEVRGDDGGALFVALGNEVVEVLVLRRSQGFQTEVIDDEQRHAGQGVEASLVSVDGARGIEGCQQLTLGGEQPHRSRRATAAWPRACAMWDFPVPQGPAMRTATFSATKRQVASSVMRVWLMATLKSKSKLLDRLRESGTRRGGCAG